MTTVTDTTPAPDLADLPVIEMTSATVRHRGETASIGRGPGDTWAVDAYDHSRRGRGVATTYCDSYEDATRFAVVALDAIADAWAEEEATREKFLAAVAAAREAHNGATEV